MFAITAIMMILGSQLSAAEHGTDDDVGWDRPQRNFSVAIFDPVMVSGSPSFSNNVTWLKVKGLENTWDRSSSDRNVFSITMMINMIIGNFFRQE